MSKNEQIGAEIGATPDEKQTDTRTPRAIRFSDSEWKRVKTAAAEYDLSVAEFVRDAALAFAGGRTGAESAAMPAGVVGLIERIYRGVYLLSTLKRDEMIREGRQDELDRIRKDARDSQASLLDGTSE